MHEEELGRLWSGSGGLQLSLTWQECQRPESVAHAHVTILL